MSEIHTYHLNTIYYRLNIWKFRLALCVLQLFLNLWKTHTIDRLMKQDTNREGSSTTCKFFYWNWTRSIFVDFVLNSFPNYVLLYTVQSTALRNRDDKFISTTSFLGSFPLISLLNLLPFFRLITIHLHTSTSDLYTVNEG